MQQHTGIYEYVHIIDAEVHKGGVVSGDRARKANTAVRKADQGTRAGMQRTEDDPSESATYVTTVGDVR